MLAEAARVTRPGGRVLVVLAGPREAPDELNAVEGDIHVRLRPENPVPATVIPMAEQAELRLAVETTTPEQAWEITPAELIRRYEERLFASAWVLDEVTVEALTAPVVAGLRALPDQERPRVRHTAHPLLVFERR